MSERLEEIKSRVWKDKGTYAMGDYSQREGYIYTLSDYDYEWLIEQVERVQDLKIMLKVLGDRNQRYKQALEEILNADCNLEGLDAERELDRVTDIALKALESDEN